MAARSSSGVKSLAFLLILSAVVLVSGCINTGGDGVAYGKGVIIESFESDMGSMALESEDEVSLMLKVQNQGEVDAINVEAILIGIDLNEWGTGYSWTGDTKDLGTLLAADPQSNTEGQTKVVQWNLEAPVLPRGTEFTYEPRVRVFYDYQTKSNKPITLVDVDELRRIIQQGKTLAGDATRSSAGPLSVQIRTGDFVKTQNYDDPFPLNIFITNDLWESGGSVYEGSGYYGSYYDNIQYPVKIKITLPDGMSLESGEHCSTSGDWVNLWKGKTADLTCEIRIDNPPEFRVEKLIQVELEYTFFMDASTTVRVIGTEEGFR
ncbi:MAG: hypothetical protein KAT35_02810 [Candidatus Aenigmarchaeota archaeon]|nr:hypothetical protein [Candidatus Aenigmarchaeota archaeon]